jgi:hypothetical protein
MASCGQRALEMPKLEEKCQIGRRGIKMAFLWICRDLDVGMTQF